MIEVKNLRKELGLTQKEFAEVFDIPVRTIEDYERGARVPAKWTKRLLIDKMSQVNDELKSLDGRNVSDIQYETIQCLKKMIDCIQYLNENAANEDKKSVSNGIKESITIPVIIQFTNGFQVPGIEYITENESILEFDTNKQFSYTEK